MSTDDRRRTYMERVSELVTEHGWMIQAVGGSETEQPFCYTVGLSLNGHPEFIIFGLPYDLSARLLNDLGERVRLGQRFTGGEQIHDLLQDFPVYLVDVVDTSTHLRVANEFVQAGSPPVTALQVVWPDAQGKFVWDEGHDRKYDAVPLLGVKP